MTDKLTPENAKGRPSKYTKEVAEEICARLAEGETLRQVCRSKHLPQESTVRGWVLDDREGFYAQYTRAREIGYESMADELLDIADDGTNDWMDATDDSGSVGYKLNGESIQRSKQRIDTRKWLLSKALPKVYGDKIDVKQTNFNVAIKGDDADL